MIQSFTNSERPIATVAAFILTYFVALSLGRFFKRRAHVPLGFSFQLFCLTLAFYAAITVYGVQANWRNHVGAALVLLSSVVVVGFVNRYLWDFYFEKKRQTPIPHFLREVFALIIFLIALLIVLSVGYHASAQLRGMVVGSGVAAIILGLAGQNLLSGIIAGVSLQMNRPYKVGDWLRVGETFGEVREINWRSTRLCTNDDIYLDIPNSEIVKTTIVNLHYPTEAHAMIETARELSKKPNTYWTDQLNNHDTITGYYSLGEEIWTQTNGKIDAFVHSVGTAASSRGVATVLKRYKPDIRIICVEPAESPVLSGGQPGSHKIEGIGIGYTPPLWDVTVVDEVIPVKTDDAKNMRPEGSLICARVAGPPSPE